MSKLTVVMVFGVFDGLHDGHKHFLREAKKCGDTLIVVVARDRDVGRYKNKSPRYTHEERMASVKKTKIPDVIIFGDRQPDSWKVIDSYTPDIIVLGYDQDQLLDALKSSENNFYKKLAIIRVEKVDD